MFAVLMICAVSMAVGLPIYWFQRRGGPGARKAHERACMALKAHGRVSIRASFMMRLIGVGSIELDQHGFTVNGWSRRSYAWLEIRQPFEIVSHRHDYSIVFSVLARKGRTRAIWGRLVRSDASAFIVVRRSLPSCYEIGAERLIELMNQLRSRASAGAEAQRCQFP